VDVDDALRLLGLDRSATWPDIRREYRTRIRAVHPDVSAGTGGDAARLNAAFAALEPAYRRGVTPPAPPTPPPPRSAATDVAPLVDGGYDDGLVLVAPADEVFLRLAAAIDEIGALTYADPDLGYLEAVVADGAGQLVVSLQGRAHATEAFFTLEPMDTRPVPALSTLVRQIAARVRAQ
jgi:hypothetical protein